MSPALLVVVLLLGTLLLIGGVLSVVFAWLPLAGGIALALAGAALETFAALSLARSRRAQSR